MQLAELSDRDPLGQNRVRSWIESLEASSPDQSQQTWGKRRCGQFDSFPSRAKRANTTGQEARALQTASGNIMAHQVEAGKRRRSPRKQPPTTPPRSTAERAQATHEELDQETPKPSGPIHRGMQPILPGVHMAVRLPPPVYNGPDSSNASSPSGRSSTSAASTRSDGFSIPRSASPVKHLADLQMAERPTVFKALNGGTAEEAGGVLGRYEELSAISQGIGAIPISLKGLVQQNLHRHDWPPAHAYASGTTETRTQAYERRVGAEVLQIHKNAEECEKGGLSEAAWNDKVNDRLFTLIVEHPKYIGVMGCTNITTARIQPKSLAMTHASGMKMEKKMVDFAIYIQPEPKNEKAIRNVLRSEPKDAQSVNQTMFGPLRMRPIAVSVETKMPFSGGETADVQLATWTGAGLTRLRQMLVKNKIGDVPIPTLPTLSTHGHDMHLMAFQEKEDENIMYGKLRLGGSDTLLGTFQMVRALEVLADWVNAEYRSWYFDKIVKPG